MIKDGLVTAIENGTAEISVEECDECKSCGACSFFGKRPSIRIPAADLEVGDRVTIDVAPGAVEWGALLVFTAPCAAFLLGAAASLGIGKTTGPPFFATNAGMALTGAAAALTGAAAALAALAVARVIDRRMAQRGPLLRVVEIVKTSTNGKDDA